MKFCTIKYFEKIVHAFDFIVREGKEKTFFGTYHDVYKIHNFYSIGKYSIKTCPAYRFVLAFFAHWYREEVGTYD